MRIFVNSFRLAIYIDHSLAWYDLKSQEEVLTHKVFAMILQAIGVPGLTGLDRMLSYFISSEVQKQIKFIDKGLKNKIWAASLKEFESFRNAEFLKSN